jgi:peptide/nickel transport system permease protein
MIGLVVLTIIVSAAIFLPLVASIDPYKTDLESGARMPPSSRHVLGTDTSARDVAARLIYGARTSLIVGFVAVTLYMAIGTVVGLVAAYAGGLTDQVLMRITDVLLAMPALLLIIVFVSISGPSIGSVITVIGLLLWPPAARIVRGQVLVLRESEFVTAARVIGVGDRNIVLRHLLPNTLAPLSVVATFGVAEAILLEAAVSFLGLGVKPPEASWGNMIQGAQSPVILNDMPWLWVPAGIMISVTVLAVNFVGDGLRDAFDPRSTRSV